jgi:hypothetical protein
VETPFNIYMLQKCFDYNQLYVNEIRKKNQANKFGMSVCSVGITCACVLHAVQIYLFISVLRGSGARPKSRQIAKFKNMMIFDDLDFLGSKWLVPIIRFNPYQCFV